MQGWRISRSGCNSLRWQLAPKVTDAGLKHLKGLTNLQSLDLGQTQVTDAGLEPLKGLTQLFAALTWDPR